MKIASVNVRGLMGQLEKRHEARNAFLDFVRTENPDVVVVCEAWLAVGKNGGNIQDSKQFLKFCEKEMVEYSKYYSLKSEKCAGIVVFSKEKVDDVYRVPYWNGRFIELTITNLRLICVCIPTSVNNMHNNSKERGMLKNVLNKRLLMLKDRNKPFIVCGDFNVAHNNIDIHHPQQHKKQAGFLDIERTQFQEYLNLGFKDEFRKFYPTLNKRYTYWNQINPKIRANNSGWRIDYFLCSEEQSQYVKNCDIWDQVYGSDHCPIYLELAY